MRAAPSKMMELEPLARAAVAGMLLSIVALACYAIGTKVYSVYYEESAMAALSLILSGVFMVAAYAVRRGILRQIWFFVRSARVDILVAAVSGGLISVYLFQTSAAVAAVAFIDPAWASLFLAVSFTGVASALLREVSVQPIRTSESLSFLSDQEISEAGGDALGSVKHAEDFAGIVARESARGALVFGVDGPWGTGKSSFINLAQKTWTEDENILVFRFEPLKFSGEKDLVRTFIRELSGRIRAEFFAPELRPLASRYSRMLKTSPAVSLPGLKISLDEHGSTIDEIINDVDEVLARIRRRVIVVVDDLDRIEYETITRVLFMIRRSILAANISYVLVYDTERIVASSKDSSTREYLEKFVNAKVSLFVDLKDLALFLQDGWRRTLPSGQSSQSDRVLGLQSILTDLSAILKGSEGGNYVGMVGNIRKLKRLINAMLLMGMERVELNQTDFDRRDLIHLILLHLNYPGVFRDIYSQEGESRSGTFSLKAVLSLGKSGYENHPDFSNYVAALDAHPRYLVAQLFDVNVLKLANVRPSKEQIDSFACFNSVGRRNLSSYLALIVRFIVPDPLETEAVYTGLLAQVRAGLDIRGAFSKLELRGNHAPHVKLWGLLAASTGSLTQASRLEAINVLIEFLPSYNAASNSGFSGRSERSAAVYSLAILINSVFGDIHPSTSDEVPLVAKLRQLLLGNSSCPGIMERLASLERGTLGIHDMMLFRLLCCADRGNQLRNIHFALASDTARNWSSARRADFVIDGVRSISQLAYEIFRERFIATGKNFIVEFAGSYAFEQLEENATVEEYSESVFVIYQLSNTSPPTGSGVGCGYFDSEGSDDRKGIARAMNKYVFEACFVPSSRPNMFVFADYCLASFSRDYFDESGVVPTQQSLEHGFDSEAFRIFWRVHGSTYKSAGLEKYERTVVTANYSARYSADLVQVWRVLDEAYLAETPVESTPPSGLEQGLL
jgi:hypothetical protein